MEASIITVTLRPVTISRLLWMLSLGMATFGMKLYGTTAMQVQRAVSTPPYSNVDYLLFYTKSDPTFNPKILRTFDDDFRWMKNGERLDWLGVNPQWGNVRICAMTFMSSIIRLADLARSECKRNT